MKFLADESCDFIVVRGLREAGYDVLSVCEMFPSMSDEEVFRFAGKGKMALLTEDKDFGQLFYAVSEKKQTVILIRYPMLVRRQLANDMINLIKLHGKKITGHFVVIQPGRVRFSK